MASQEISGAGLRILRLLVGRRPRTVAELMAEAGVTRTAVTEQLSELMAAGLVERTTQRVSRRGRPCHLYRATPRAIDLLSKSNLRRVLPALLSVMQERLGDEETLALLDQVSRRVAQQYQARIDAPSLEDRVRQLAQLLEDEGILVEVQRRDGRLVLRQRTCPYVEMVDERRIACRMEQQILSHAIGQPLELCDCRLDGSCGCEFVVAAPANAAHS